MRTHVGSSRRSGGIVGLALILGLWGFANGRIWAEEVQRVVVTVGGMQTVELPFDLKNFSVANRSVVKIESQGNRKVQIIGLAEGTTDLLVSGEGNATANYSVSVEADLDQVLKSVRKRLQDIPGVEVTREGNHIVIEGTVSKVDDWNLLRQVESRYGGIIDNCAKRRVLPDLLVNLKKALEAGGFVVADAVTGSSAPGTLALVPAGFSVQIIGMVYSKSDLERTKLIVLGQRWTIAKDQAETTEGDKPTAIFDVGIVPVHIEVDVAFVGVTSSEEEKIGVNLAKAGLLTIDTTAAAFAGTIGRNASSGFTGSYTVNSGLSGALEIFKSVAPDRTKSLGHLTIKNNADEMKTLQTGGTLNVRVSGTTSGGLEKIEYGFILGVKGGLRDKDTVDVELSMELSTPEMTKAGDYDIVKNKVTTSVSCPFGKTLVVAGHRQLTEGMSTEKVPILGSIPVLGWLFSEKKHALEDRKMLILFSPQLAMTPADAAPLSDQTKSVQQQVEQPLKK